jgi:hypothetical protein
MISVLNRLAVTGNGRMRYVPVLCVAILKQLEGSCWRGLVNMYGSGLLTAVSCPSATTARLCSRFTKGANERAYETKVIFGHN